MLMTNGPVTVDIAPPEPGAVVEIAPGLLWARIALPFKLDHVNIFLLEDGDGWAIVDTAVNDAPTRAAFKALLSGPLAGQRFTRLIVTHHHPDHIGLAGWLCARFDLPLHVSQTAYMGCLVLLGNPAELEAQFYSSFYQRHGMTPEHAAVMGQSATRYRNTVGAPPRVFHRLLAGDRLTIGAREFEVLSGDGHAPEQIMLYSPADNLLLVADQVILGITPNVSVWPTEPEGDPLGHYLRSLELLVVRVPDDALVLPGHKQPFRGLHRRIAELRAHHDERFDLILRACRAAPLSVADLVPLMFPRTLDAQQFGFAFSEAHAHVNHLLRQRRLALAGPDLPLRYRSL